MSKYRSKKSSCGLCKPHKMGQAPKDTERQDMEARLAQSEMIEHPDQQGLHPAEIDLIEYEATPCPAHPYRNAGACSCCARVCSCCTRKVE